MASEAALQFHRQSQMISGRNLASRIEYGTKSTTPDVRVVRRMNPLNYSNPLPDNSSGSKIRPFNLSKDESGRPNAMEIVAMNQSKGGMRLSGGVLKDYKYAQMILKRRGQDTENIKLAAQQLPPQFPPLLELDDVDKQKLTLTQVISKIQDDLDTGDITNLTYDSMKTLGRSLVLLAPTFDEKDITQLSRVFVDMLETINSRVQSQGLKLQLDATRSARGIQQYINKFINPFIEVLAKAVKLPENTKRALITSSARQLFATVTEAEDVPKNIIKLNNNRMIAAGENIADRIDPRINYLSFSEGSIKKQIENLEGVLRDDVEGYKGPFGPRSLQITIAKSIAKSIKNYIIFFTGKKGYEAFLRKLEPNPRQLQTLFRDYINDEVTAALNKITTDKESQRVYESFQKILPIIPDTPELPEGEEFDITRGVPRPRPQVAPLPAPVPGEQVEAAIEAPLPAVEAPVAAPSLSEEERSAYDAFMKLTKETLKQACRDNELLTSGTKPELAFRLVKAGFVPNE
jgi:hypothetical protein